ncbi:MAG: hypothetical protein KBD64_02680 [Gammaproteobacteria bacterium]|nr:hypothetical protein [Gammaproteobacteria bacterium]
MGLFFQSRYTADQKAAKAAIVKEILAAVAVFKENNFYGENFNKISEVVDSMDDKTLEKTYSDFQKEFDTYFDLDNLMKKSVRALTNIKDDIKHILEKFDRKADQIWDKIIEAKDQDQAELSEIQKPKIKP